MNINEQQEWEESLDVSMTFQFYVLIKSLLHDFYSIRKGLLKKYGCWHKE
jgi:hypothetical protein